MRFATRSLLLVWPANGLVITPGTLLLGWCRGQKRLVQRFANDCGHLCHGISGVLIEWDDDFGKSARRSAKIQTSAIDLQLSTKEFFSYQRIECWLQGFSAGNDLTLFSISLAGLVVADANVPGRMARNSTIGAEKPFGARGAVMTDCDCPPAKGLVHYPAGMALPSVGRESPTVLPQFGSSSIGLGFTSGLFLCVAARGKKQQPKKFTSPIASLPSSVRIPR